MLVMKLPLLAVAAFLSASALAHAPLITYEAVPSHIDPGVHKFDEPNVAITSPNLPKNAPLVVFMPGTGGRPQNAIDLLTVVAGQGYRVIGLEYDDAPAVVQVCPQNPDPDCSAQFREVRITGNSSGHAPVTNPQAESIVSRLVAMLRTLDKAHPVEGWGQYVDGDQPRWDRLVLSGLSQGAGMAAFMAKQHLVRRVVLFSSPWDFVGQDRSPAPWLSNASVTPMTRWQAEYHQRENTAELLQTAYRRLNIPPENVRVFSRDLPQGFAGKNPNPFHGATIRDTRYANEWRSMFGRADEL